MLNARNREKVIPSMGPVSETATVGSFGTVLESVQGLQQRLGDFSIDEIGEAEASVRTLISRVAELAGKVDRIAEVMRSVAAARAKTTEAASEIVEIPKLGVLDHSLPVHLIAQATNLIPFPRTKKASIANIEPSQPAAALKLDHGDELESEADTVTDRGVKSGDIASESRGREPEEAVGIALVSEHAFDSDSPANEAATPEHEKPEELAFPREDFPSHAGDEDTSRLEVARILAKDFNHLPDGGVGGLLESAPVFEFAKPEEQTAETKRGDAAGADFDQRLLDDLIKNYGEFIASPASAARVEETAAPGRPARPADVPRDRRAAASPSPVDPSLPSVRKQGQLDRELKKIIKDYGEVDLYSRQSPIKFKIAAIAAFVLLGALVAGFYFYYAPNIASVRNPAGVSATADQTLMGSGGTQESAGKTEKSGAIRGVTPGQSDGAVERNNSEPSVKKNSEQQSPLP